MPSDKNSEFTIYYYPPMMKQNEYCERMKSILSNCGTVKTVDSSYELLKRTIKTKKRADIFVINWLDNLLINSCGSIDIKHLIKFFLKIIFYKLVSKKIVFVRHNIYPHNTVNKDKNRAKKIISFAYKLFGTPICHSPVYGNEYIPHPLYGSSESDHVDNQDIKSLSDYYVMFGRIEKYKNIDKVLDAFPADKQLIIAGPCSDKEYLSTLESYKRDNVTIIADFISNNDACYLLQHSQGLILAHDDSSMIISGSLYFALSNYTRVISIKNDFFAWIENKLPGFIVLGVNTQEVCQKLETLEYKNESGKNYRAKINELFGDEYIAACWKSLFEKLITNND